MEQQIERCEIAEYDVTGWCDVNVLDGPAATTDMLDGPYIDLTNVHDVTVTLAPSTGTQFTVTRQGLSKPMQIGTHGPPGSVGIILWSNERGFLYAIEIVHYGGGHIVDPYAVCIEADALTPSRVEYPSI